MRVRPLKAAEECVREILLHLKASLNEMSLARAGRNSFWFRGEFVRGAAAAENSTTLVCLGLSERGQRAPGRNSTTSRAHLLRLPRHSPLQAVSKDASSAHEDIRLDNGDPLDSFQRTPSA